MAEHKIGKVLYEKSMANNIKAGSCQTTQKSKAQTPIVSHVEESWPLTLRLRIIRRRKPQSKLVISVGGFWSLS
jgi:hypothetical protein